MKSNCSPAGVLLGSYWGPAGASSGVRLQSPWGPTANLLQSHCTAYWSPAVNLLDTSCKLAGPLLQAPCCKRLRRPLGGLADTLTGFADLARSSADPPGGSTDPPTAPWATEDIGAGRTEHRQIGALGAPSSRGPPADRPWTNCDILRESCPQS